MSHTPFPNNNGHNVSEDFLNLTLALSTWSSTLPASDAAPPLPRPPSPSSCVTSNLSSVIPPFSNPYKLDPALCEAIQSPSHHQQCTAVGGQSYHQHMVVEGPPHHQHTTIGGPFYHQHTVVGGPPHLQHTVVGGPSHHQHTVVGGPPHHQHTVVGGPSHHQHTAVRDPLHHQGTTPRGPTHQQRTAAGGPIRNNRTTRRTLRPGQSETITPPYPWATDHRAIIHNLQYIQSKGINTVTGKVKCTECNRDFDIKYDLRTKFKEVQNFVIVNKDTMWQRAPEVWKSPAQLDCQICNKKKCVKPILGKKRSINWLFLLLGQMIGFCKHTELKYFCKHTGNHKTGAKDRVLYLTYMELCRQLDPQGDYDP